MCRNCAEATASASRGSCGGALCVPIAVCGSSVSGYRACNDRRGIAFRDQGNRFQTDARCGGWVRLRSRIRLKKPEFEDVLVLKGWVLIDGR